MSGSTKMLNTNNYAIDNRVALGGQDLFDYLAGRNNQEKHADLYEARDSLKDYLGKIPSEQDETESVRFLRAYYNELDQLLGEKTKNAVNLNPLSALDGMVTENNDAVPVADMPKITELTHRVLYNAQHPESDQRNKARAIVLAQDISQRKWGRTLGGIALALFGVVLIAAAVAALMASFGAAGPLSAALGVVGIKVTAAALTGMLGTTGVQAGIFSGALFGGAVVSGGVYLGLSAKPKYPHLGTSSLAFFNRKTDDAPAGGARGKANSSSAAAPTEDSANRPYIS